MTKRKGPPVGTTWLGPQNQRVIRWLMGGGTLNTVVAKYELGITNLYARVSELRALGYPIKDEWDEESVRTGRRSKAYYLEDGRGEKVRGKFDEKDLHEAAIQWNEYRRGVEEGRGAGVGNPEKETGEVETPMCPNCGATRFGPGPEASEMTKRGGKGSTQLGWGDPEIKVPVLYFDTLPDGTVEFICLDCGRVFSE